MAIFKTGFMAFFGLMTIVIIVLGVNGGVMTATESAAVRTLSMIFVLIACSNAFGWLVAYLKIPAMITNGLLALTSNKFLILLMVNVLLLGLGMVMSMSSIIIILTPILVPVLEAVGVNLVQFGCVMILNLGVGLITPPVGAALYIGSAISGIKVNRLVRSMLPLYLIMLAVLLMITYIPEISLWLPKFLGYIK